MAEKTKWEGLWGQNTRTGFYISKTYSKKNLPDRFKVVLRYNKFYEKDSRKPRFIFSLAESDAANAIVFDIEDYGVDLEQEYLTPHEAWCVAVDQYDGRHDPYDVYAHCDFRGRPLREILMDEVEE